MAEWQPGGAASSNSTWKHGGDKESKPSMFPKPGKPHRKEHGRCDACSVSWFAKVLLGLHHGTRISARIGVSGLDLFLTVAVICLSFCIFLSLGHTPRLPSPLYL